MAPGEVLEHEKWCPGGPGEVHGRSWEILKPKIATKRPPKKKNQILSTPWGAKTMKKHCFFNVFRGDPGGSTEALGEFEWVILGSRGTDLGSFWHQAASCGASVGPLVQQVQNQGAFWSRLGAFGGPFGCLWGAFGAMLTPFVDLVFEACFRMPFLIVFESFFFHFWYHVGCFLVPRAPIARFTETFVLL